MKAISLLLVFTFAYFQAWAQLKDVRSATTIYVQNNTGIINSGNNVTINNYFPTKMIEEINQNIRAIMESVKEQNEKVKDVLDQLSVLDQKYKNLDTQLDKAQLFEEQVKIRYEQINLQQQISAEMPDKKADLDYYLAKNQLVVQGAKRLAVDQKENLETVDGVIGFKELSIGHNYVVVFEYREGVAVAKRSNKYGFIDLQRNLIADFQYDSLSSCHEGLLRARRLRGGLWSFVDKKNKVVISEEQLAEVIETSDFRLGLAKMRNKNKRYYFVDKKGNLISHNNYEQLRDFNQFNLAIFKNGSYFGFINLKGEEVHQSYYKTMLNFDDLGYLRVYYANNYCLLVNTLGQEFLKEERYENLTEVGSSPNGLIVGFKKGNNWGYYNLTQKKVIATPAYTYVEAFKNDYAVVGNQEGKGVIDANDCQIVRLKFDNIELLNNGTIKITKNNATFLMKPTGGYGNCDLECLEGCEEFKKLNR